MSKTPNHWAMPPTPEHLKLSSHLNLNLELSINMKPIKSWFEEFWFTSNYLSGYLDNFRSGNVSLSSWDMFFSS